MRIVSVLMTATLLALAGCSVFADRSSTSENVHTAYAGTASMTADQVTQVLHNQGYNHVTDLHRNGEDWVGAATDNGGKHVDFDMDKSGVVHTK